MLHERYRTRWLYLGAMLFSSFVGLGACKLIEGMFFKAGQGMIEHPIWSVVIMTLGLGFAFTLVVLVPVQILIVERSERRELPRENLTLTDVVGLPVGATNPNAQIPKWISYPILVVLWGFILFVVFGLISAFVLGPLLGD